VGKKSPRIGPLDQVRHQQAGDRKEDGSAGKTKASIEDGWPSGITELSVAIIRCVIKQDKEGSQPAQALYRWIFTDLRHVLLGQIVREIYTALE
jgi:hypothetical protein